MRTRKSNKKKSFNFADKYDLGSEDSSEEREEIRDVDEDVDFEEAEGDEEDRGASEEREGDDEMNVEIGEGKELSGDEEANGAQRGHDEDMAVGSDIESEDFSTSASATAPIGRGKLSQRTSERGVIHEVPSYATDLHQTRVYGGPLKTDTRGTHLLTLLYGPQPGHLKVIRQIMDKWFQNQTLPNKHAGTGVMQSPWLAEDYEEKQKHWSRTWYGKYRAAETDLQRLRRIRPDHVHMFKPPMDELVCFLGPFNSQKQVRTSYGFGQSISGTGEPLGVTDPNLQQFTPPRGWMMDTGGIPLAIGWAPLVGHQEQFLAVCSIPYSDHEPKDAESPGDDPDEKKKGSVQIWSIPCHRTDDSHARLACSLSFDFGRPKRLQWCPVPPPDDSKIGLLAILCADGQVRVVEVPKTTAGQDNYEWITSPVATFGITDEYMVRATCLAWVNTNRVCLGHSDGTVSLWSVYPQQMIARHAVHVSQVLDIASAFPSHPYHIATVPVGGSPTLTDLNLPSAETTSIPLVRCVSFQPNLLDWNDHLQGFTGFQPSPAPHNTVIGWSHIRFFVQSRTLMTTPSMPMCVASGRTHPFTLVGCADGSLWAFNPLRVLMKTRGDELHKLKILEHEFRPPSKIASSAGVGAEEIRGAARILQGFRPEFNVNPRMEILAEMKKETNVKPKKSKSKGKSRGRKVPEREQKDDGENEDGLKRIEEVALLKTLDQTKAVVHEARTRITVAAWNPNVEYGWWAAVAMGSGLVKVMDLGIDD